SYPLQVAPTTPGLTSSPSNSFVISAAAADHLAFLQQPTSTTAGAAISPAVTVQVLDQFNNLTGSTANVTVAATGPGAFTAASTTTVAAVAGGATFSNLHLNVTGSYTIGATATGLAPRPSSNFCAIPGAADPLVVQPQPSATATAGVAFATQPVVRLEDAFNNLLTTDSTHTVTAARGSKGTANLQGSNLTVTLAGGVATFSGLSYN